MRDKDKQDEIVALGVELRQPPQVGPICRAPFASSTTIGTTGVEPQIGVIDLLKCGKNGCHAA